MASRMVTMLARFTRDEQNTPDDIRDLVEDGAERYADELGDDFAADVARLEDARVRGYILSAIKAAALAHREGNAKARARAAQESADVLATVCKRRGKDGVDLDVLTLLASCLTTPKACLYVHVDGAPVAFPMAPLLASARVILDEARAGSAFAYVEGTTLSIRWRNTRGTLGGFNWRGARCAAEATYSERPGEGGDRVRVIDAYGAGVYAHPEDVHLHVPCVFAGMTGANDASESAAE